MKSDGELEMKESRGERLFWFVIDAWIMK